MSAAHFVRLPSFVSDDPKHRSREHHYCLPCSEDLICWPRTPREKWFGASSCSSSGRTLPMPKKAQSRICEQQGGFEPPWAKPRVLQTRPFVLSGTAAWVPPVGFEPTIIGLKVRCRNQTWPQGHVELGFAKARQGCRNTGAVTKD